MPTLAAVPAVVGSTPSPGMKWSTPLVMPSTGTREGSVQVSPPSLEVVITMSLDEHPTRKRQSAQATYMLPLASVSAVGSAGARMPVGLWYDTVETATTVVLNVLPPSVERTAPMLPSAAPMMTRVPSG